VISAKQFSEATVTGLVFQMTGRSILAEAVTDIKRFLTIYASFFKIIKVNSEYCGPGSVHGIATGYGLDGLGIECRWG
jgi:hypothetical protein